MSLTPQDPVRADHRFIMKLVGLTLDSKVHPSPSEFDLVSRVFSKAGGSWERVFKGSPEDIARLKQVLKLAFKHGFLTKKEPWVPKQEKQD